MADRNRRASRVVTGFAAAIAALAFEARVAFALPSIVNIRTDAVDNATAHRTSSFGNPGFFVVRRGQAFDVSIELSESLSEGQKLRIVASNTFLDGDTVEEEVLNNWPNATAPPGWLARIHAPTPTPQGLFQYVARLRAPVDGAVGRYEFQARIVEGGGGGGKPLAALDFPQPVVILFNPWRAGDGVHLTGESSLNEYVLAQATSIWAGTSTDNSAISWNVGQFSTTALDATLAMLDGLTKADRRNPAEVARHLAARVNSDDSDGGVLTGRWIAPYDRCYRGLPSSTTCSRDSSCDSPVGAGNGRCGSRPWTWKDSASILTKHLAFGGDVRHAQCPAFGGVLLTTLRSLGIPARVVTGFDAVVDADLSGALDTYYTQDARGFVRQDPGESTWNFHVWVEAWMRRAGTFGWQALDATPQLRSGGKYRVGPAPLAAVRSTPPALLELTYDVTFVRSQVTAPTKVWVRNSAAGAYSLTGTRAKVSPRVLTRRPGQSATVSPSSVLSDDVTSGYLAATTATANSLPVTRAMREVVVSGEVAFDLATTPDVVVGDTATWTLHLRNDGSTTRTVNISFNADAVANTGELLTPGIADQETTETLAAGESRDVVFEVAEADYAPELVQTRIVAVTTTAAVVETGGAFVDVSRAVVGVPGLDVTATPDNVPTVGEPRTVSVEFENPLAYPMTGVVLRYETGDGSTIGGTSIVEVPFADVMPGASVTDSQTFVNLDGAVHVVAVSLASAELDDLSGDVVFATAVELPTSLCGGVPLGGCREAAIGASSFSLRLGKTPAKNLLKWKWAKGDDTGTDEFLDPDSGSPVSRLCVYDGSASVQPLMEVDVASGGTCGDAPCWKRAASGALSYRNKAGSDAGITGVKLKPGVAGKASVQVLGKGSSLSLPGLPLVGPVTVQWVASTGLSTQCWQTTYQEVDSDEEGIKASGPSEGAP